MSNLRSSLQRELDRFFKKLDSEREAVTDSALCQARLKLLPAIFATLNQRTLEHFYRSQRPRRFHGFRLLSEDGSTVRLRGVKNKCACYFAGEKGWDEQATPLARISTCYDVMNGLAVDSTIAPYDVGEHSLAHGHFQNCGSQDLILLDRNYPTFWLLRDLQNRSVRFCVRVPVGRWKRLLRFFMNSSQQATPIEWKPSARQRHRCQELEIEAQPLQLRLVKIVLNTGEIEVLATNLDSSWTVKELGELYRLRWSVEEHFKLDKSRSEIERWTGKSQIAVEQDFYGRIFLQNLSALLSVEADDHVKEQTAHARYVYQVNRTRALSHLREVLVQLVLATVSVAKTLARLMDQLTLKPCPIRPGRKYPRKSRPRADFAFAYKPIS